jgi:acyl-CoA synthetase (NDP forming)
MLESVAVRMPHARVNGFLIAPYLSGGHELIMGVSRDPVFGPVVMVGFGGIHAEVLKDVALQVAPINHREARAMIEGLRLFPILDGARGQPRADLDAAVDALVRLSNFAVEHQEVVAEVDLNPVRVMPNGRGLWVLDALMVPRLISDTAIAGGDA